MSYIGRVEQKASDIRRFNVTGSTSATHTLTWTPPNEQSLIITINGVKQQEDAYSVSGTTLTLTSALVSTDKMEVVGIQDVGETVVPGTGVITNDHISSTAAIAQSKLSLDITNSDVNASAAIALSKLASDPSNASNLASGTVPTARLGSGTASSSTFLRGDQSWASAGVSNEVVAVHLSADQSLTKNVIAKVEFDTEDLDANGWFDNSTNYRFTPDEAGDYLFSCQLTSGNGTSSGDAINLYFYKNGSEVYSNETGQQSGYLSAISGSAIIALNGSSDYVEVYSRNGANGTLTLDAQGFNAATATNCRLVITKLVD